MSEQYDNLSEDSVISDDKQLEVCNQVHFYNDKEDNPYEIIEHNKEENLYQLLGNDIIYITKGEGICCLCSEISTILYADNSYCNNIPIQICKTCVIKILS